LDDQEWDDALEACYARVLRALIGACGSRERAEDGLQDALVAAWKPGVREHVQRPDPCFATAHRRGRSTTWSTRTAGVYLGRSPNVRVAGTLLLPRAVRPAAVVTPPTTTAPKAIPRSLSCRSVHLTNCRFLDIDFPSHDSVPGARANSAEEAFRRTFPAITTFTLYAFGKDQPETAPSGNPVWVVAGPDTYVAYRLGDANGPNNWFAYRPLQPLPYTHITIVSVSRASQQART
jgi:hypothetical protein